MENTLPYQEPEEQLRMHPKKFILWIFMVSIIMLFAGLTSALIVKRAEGNWLEFDLPNAFITSTIVIFASSITMHLSVRSARDNNISMMRLWLIITTVLGFAFLFFQWVGWSQLVDSKVFLADNAAGSFVYVITGAHGAHIISGLVFLTITLAKALQYKIHSLKMNTIEMCATYWHFLDALWLFLFFFLLVNR
jgi:cytochrome c oxidase subunit 3